ncbi:MAG: hypothetical protein HY292_26540 [Planctomycetes bacterium]|nr:hypothetical protein [Planctomycetota bacterium]
MVAEKHFTPKGARAERIPCSAQSVRRARRALRETMAAVCRDVLAGSTDEATRRAYENYLAFLESSAVKGRTTFTELVEFLRRRFREKGTSQSE